MPQRLILTDRLALSRVSGDKSTAVLALDTHGLEAGGWTLELQLDGQPLRKSNILAFTILPTPWGK